MKLLFGYLKGHKGSLSAALVLAVINIFFSLLDPQIFRLIIDKYATQFDSYTKSDFISGVLLLLLASMGVAFVSRVAKNFQDYYVTVTTQRVGTKMYSDSVDHAFSLPFRAFEDRRSGEILQKLQKARLDSEKVIASFINVVFLSLVGIVFVVVYAYWVNVWIGLAFSVTIPGLGITIFYLTKRIKDIQKDIVAKSADLSGSTTETLRNVELVKSLGLEDQEIERLNSVNEEILQLEIEKTKHVRALMFIQGTLINATRSGILFLMIYLIFASRVTLGEFFSLWFYSFAVFSPLSESGRVATEYQEAKASLEQLDEILNLPADVQRDNAKVVDQIRELCFRDVSFTYANQKDRKIGVKDISVCIKSGNQVAFVGPSGAGKSTLLKLLVGLYRPDSGSVTVNSNALDEVDVASFRARIGYVSQSTQLFSGTIRENLLFVKPDATDEECTEALENAKVSSILSSKGLSTRIGEGGLKLSGGERQRLAIARALLRKPDLLIFDEATSSLDSITEGEITETISTIAKQNPNLIMIIVAHRLSTVSHVDQIYVLEKGLVIEDGSHKELLSASGLYSALWREQQGNNSR